MNSKQYAPELLSTVIECARSINATGAKATLTPSRISENADAGITLCIDAANPHQFNDDLQKKIREWEAAVFGNQPSFIYRKYYPSDRIHIDLAFFENPACAPHLDSFQTIIKNHQLMAQAYDGKAIAQKLSQVFNVAIKPPYNSYTPEATRYHFHVSKPLNEAAANHAAAEINKRLQQQGISYISARSQYVFSGHHSVDFVFDKTQHENILGQLEGTLIDLNPLFEAATSIKMEPAATPAKLSLWERLRL